MDFVIAIIALAAGAAFGFIFGHSRGIADKQRDCDAALDRQLAQNRDNLASLQAKFDETVERMKAELQNTTAELLRQRQTEFAASSSDAVSKILEPLNKNIEQMRQAVNDNTQKHIDIGGQLSSSLSMVMKHSDDARNSAERLADALRGGGKIQGDWGEKVLTELLESQGLKEGVHFDTQVSFNDCNSNARLRPDVILHLDKNRDVIIDSKVSLSAFLDYKNAQSDERRQQALDLHVLSIKNHVKELVNKNYTSALKPGRSLDYVIMFVPCTAAVYAATDKEPDLWRKAMEKGVYIADEQTLYAALRIIDMTWQQIKQAGNHEEVYRLAGEMLDRVSAFAKSFQEIQSKINALQGCYDTAWKKLQDKGQSIPSTCKKLRKLGAKNARVIAGVDPDLIGIDTDDDDSDIPALP